jgi:hypothetical protein
MTTTISTHLLPSEYKRLKNNISFLIRELEQLKHIEQEHTKTLILLQKQNTKLHEEIIKKDKLISMLLTNV